MLCFYQEMAVSSNDEPIEPLLKNNSIIITFLFLRFLKYKYLEFNLHLKFYI